MLVWMTVRDFTRFFWLSNPEDPESEFQVYRFKTVLFDSASSPFMLNATLHHHLNQYNTPVDEDMKENLYVDNVISGCDQELEVLAYYKEARSIMNEATPTFIPGLPIAHHSEIKPQRMGPLIQMEL